MENQTTQIPIQEEIPHHPKKRFPVLLLAFTGFVFLLVILFAYLAYQNAQLKKQIISLQSNPSPTSDVTADSTANWETYIHPLKAYSFEHPANLKFDAGPIAEGLESIRFTYYGPSQIEGTDLYDGYQFVVTSKVKVSSQNTLESITQRSREGGCPDLSLIGVAKKTLLAGREALTYDVDCLVLDFTRYLVSDGKIIYEIEQFYMGEPKDQAEYKKILDQILLTFKFTDEIPIAILNQEVKSSVLQTFIDSLGKTKYVLYKIADDDASYSYNIYLSSQSSLSNEAIKLFTGVQNIDGVPFVTSNKDNVSSQSGKKYLIFDHMAGTTEFWLFDENGNNIKVDLSKMGLGTTIPGMYGLKFGAWIPNTTNFKIKAISANGKNYEATFDATTGFQIGDTIEIGN